MSPPPRVVAVVVTYRRREVLERTVQAVLDQSLPVHAAIVVDNASDAAVRASVTALSSRVQYIALSDNPGFGAGLAAGLELAHAEFSPDWYWLLDDDSPPAPSALACSLSAVEGAQVAEGEIGVVATRGGHIRRGRVRHDLAAVSGDTALPGDFGLVDGAIVSSAAVEKVGLPRRDLFMMFEDIEYTTRVRLAGFRILVRPRDGSTFLHMGSSAPWRGYYQARNHLRVAVDLRRWTWLWGWFVRETAIGLRHISGGRFHALWWRWRGAYDAVRNRMGRTLEP